MGDPQNGLPMIQNPLNITLKIADSGVPTLQETSNVYAILGHGKKSDFFARFLFSGASTGRKVST